MGIERFEKDMGIISKLGDQPNEQDGLVASQLKAKFDEGGEMVKTYLNDTLIPALEGAGGAGRIGSQPFEGIPGTTVQEQLQQVDQKVNDVVLGQIPDGSITPEKLSGIMRSYYIRFEPEDWTETELRVSKSVHGLPVTMSICARTLHMLVGRSAEEYGAATREEGRERFIAMEAAALAANTATPGTYPTAADGHVQLAWEQVQYYLLEETLAETAAAAAKAGELGFDWKGRETVQVAETISLDALLAAAYTPALGGSSAAFDALWTVEAVQGLRLRRGVPGVNGAGKKYDLDGRMSSRTWGVMESDVRLDLETGDLVICSGTAFAGELLVIANP